MIYNIIYIGKTYFLYTFLKIERVLFRFNDASLKCIDLVFLSDHLHYYTLDSYVTFSKHD